MKRAFEQPPAPGGGAPNGGGGSAEAASLQGEAAWLKQQNAALQQQLAQLQQQHMSLSAAAAAPAPAPMQQQQRPPMPAPVPAPAPAPAAPHNPAWTEQTNPENGTMYFWNTTTGESTYTKPADYNPGAPTIAGGGRPGPAPGSTGLSGAKGPPGANLFIVRKMRRGEYDEFNDVDLAREFSKFGQVTRAEMTVDKETGWSKGFGFVSFATVAEADVAMQSSHGSWMAGRELKVEKTKENN